MNLVKAQRAALAGGVEVDGFDGDVSKDLAVANDQAETFFLDSIWMFPKIVVPPNHPF